MGVIVRSLTLHDHVTTVSGLGRNADIDVLLDWSLLLAPFTYHSNMTVL